MPKKISISIKERVEVLEKYHRNTKSSLKRDRIKALLLIKKGSCNFQSEIGKKLGRTEKTVRQWLKQYASEGIEGLLEIKSGGNNTKIISPSLEAYISEKVKDPLTTITSYVELQMLIEEELGQIISYGTLYMHCRRRYRTKLKVSRKSHQKKDPQAERLFKKP